MIQIYNFQQAILSQINYMIKSEIILRHRILFRFSHENEMFYGYVTENYAFPSRDKANEISIGNEEKHQSSTRIVFYEKDENIVAFITDYIDINLINKVIQCLENIDFSLYENKNMKEIGPPIFQ